jgi:hypothetical protein
MRLDPTGLAELLGRLLWSLDADFFAGVSLPFISFWPEAG